MVLIKKHSLLWERAQGSSPNQEFLSHNYYRIVGFIPLQTDFAIFCLWNHDDFLQNHHPRHNPFIGTPSDNAELTTQDHQYQGD